VKIIQLFLSPFRERHGQHTGQLFHHCRPVDRTSFDCASPSMGIQAIQYFLKFLIAWFLLLSTALSLSIDAYSVHLPPKISLSIPDGVCVEGREIPLYIVVDHMPQDEADVHSFLLNDSPLQVVPQQEERVAPKELFKESDQNVLMVNRYRATLPKKTAGVYNIGPVTAIIGGARYSSDIITVHVQAAISSKEFRLETKIEVPPKIFPGQQVTFEYRIFFQGAMQLLREDLPMLNVQGFITSSSPQVSTEQTDHGFVQVIKQQAKAVTPGTYEIGVSIIEGMRMEGTQGSAALIPPLYRSEAPSKPITILPFPEAQKPSSFDGALGSFVWRTSLLSDENAVVGEPVRVEYRVSGRGELGTVHFPSFDRLSGLIDSFWTDATPPVGEQAGGTKTFVLVVRPKRIGPVEIPGFFFTSFDPYSGQYLTASVPPIKLAVEGSKELKGEPVSLASGPEPILAPPFEIDSSTAAVRYVSPVWIGITLVSAIVIGTLQYMAFKRIKSRTEKKMTSKDLFYRAVMNRSNREKGLQLLRQAFYTQLYEMGLTPAIVDSPEAIPGEGLAAEVKALLQQIERQLYKVGEPKESLQEIYDEASSLYYRMKHLNPRA
jgi:hypothetical protein